MTLRKASPPALSALWGFLRVLTESNCEGNNEDGHTYCNTTSYQDHLLDWGMGGETRKAKCQIMILWMWRMGNRGRRKDRKRKKESAGAHALIRNGEIIM